MKTNFKWFQTMVFLLISVFIMGQVKTITGTVKDENGQPVPSASVRVKGTDKTVITDFNGNYAIEAKEGDVLVIDDGSGNQKEATVGKSTTVAVSFTKDDNVLSDVVVTALGIKRQERALSYAATIVDGNQIREVTTSDPFSSLSGKVPGLDISTPLQPGASTKIISRGYSSIVNNQTLLVVDGTPLINSSASKSGFDSTYDSGNSLNDIDPNTIESINFLRGAAATALYGKDGGNGAIIVVTKKGKRGIKLDINSSVDFNEVARLPHIQYVFGQGWSGLGFSNVVGEGSAAVSNENGSWGPRFNGDLRPWGRIVNNSQQIKYYNPLEDNLREFFDIGVTHTNSIALSGGGENATGSFTYSKVVSDGIFPTEQDLYKKDNIGFTGGIKSDKFALNVSGNYTHKKQNSVPTGQGDDASFGPSFFQEFLQMPNDISILDLEDQSNIFNTPSYFFTPYASNPYSSLANNNVRTLKDRFYGNVNANYTFNDKWSAYFQWGADFESEYVKRWGAKVDYIDGSPQDLAAANPVVGAVQEVQVLRRLYDVLGRINYETQLNDDFALTANLGTGYQEANGNAQSIQVTGLDIPGFYEISNSANAPVVVQNDYTERYYYLFGQGELSYKNRYFFTVTARNDWSSNLPKKANSYPYPSVGVSGVVIDDGNFLKLRASWAQAGNSAPIYRIYGTTGQGSNDAYFGVISYPFGGVNSYEIGGRIENPNLKNELTTEIELGAEGKFFRNRLNFDLSFYNRITDDMLFGQLVSPSTGYESIFGNFGSIRNRGIELMIDSYPIKNENFKWNFTYTFTKNDSEVLDLSGVDKITLENPYGVSFNVVEGEDFGTFWAQVPKMTADGQYIVNPDTGFYEITDEEQKIGTAERDFVMGFMNRFTYKDLTLGFSIDWKQGGDMYSYTKRLSHFVGNGIETIYNDRNPFIIPNSVIDNGDGTYSENTTPISFEDVTNFYNTQNNPGMEQTHVIDKTFIRLRDLSLTYKLPAHWFGDKGIKDMSFTVYGRNLFLWTPKENPYVDPEATTYGTDIGSEVGEFSANPTQRVYGFNVKLTF